MVAGQAAKPPVVDGDIGTDEWQGAGVVRGFVQLEPRRGEPSAVETEALVLHDANALYVAFRARDTEPPVAQLTQRDADLLDDDDSVMVLLDSFDDHRSAYYFTTNVLGTQADGRIADDGRTVDSSWDATWTSAARRDAAGFTVEIRIPLASIKYVAGGGRTWGLNLARSRRRNLEVSYWSGPPERMYQVSAAGALSGLTVPAPKKRFEVIPYALLRAEQGKRSDADIGGDVRFSLTPQTALYATVHPDFATIEADQEEVNLSRFEVSLPEKRPFFLEGAEQFQQRIRTFYSRRIADISWGGKLLGKQGPWSFAGIGTRTETTAAAPQATFTAARLKRDVLRRSNVALMLTNRTRQGLDEGAAEIDTNLVFSETLGFTGQLVRTHGRFDEGAWAFFLRPSYDSSTGHFHVRYTSLGDRVRDNLNGVGFVSDDDRRELDSAVEKTFWVRSGALEKVEYGSNYNVYWSQAGPLRSWEIDQGLSFDLRNRLSAEIDYTEEFKRFEKDFRNRQLGFEIGYNTREYQSIRVGYELGRNFDSDYGLWKALGRLKLTKELSLEYELERLSLHPDPEQESTWIHVLRANQFFTKDLFLRVFFQTNSAIDRKNLQAIVVYRYKPPFGTFQLAFQRGTAAFGERSRQGNTLFLKATAVF